MQKARIPTVSDPLKGYHPEIKALAHWLRPAVEQRTFSNEIHPVFKPRMGWMKYLNTFPMRCAYADMFAAHTAAYQGELIHHPTMLNQALACGVLDVSLVSTAAYFAHRTEWHVLPELCIASSGPVNSVLWLQQKNFNPSKHALCIPQASASSVALLKHVLTHQQGCPTQEVIYPPGTPWQHLLETHHNVLLIGDAALRFYSEWSSSNLSTAWSSLSVMDLASEWKAQTGHPFIFGVWCTPIEYAHQHETALQALFSRLMGGTCYHLNHPSSLYERYMAELVATTHSTGYPPPFSQEILQNYWLENLTYVLEPAEFEAALTQAQHRLTVH